MKKLIAALIVAMPFMAVLGLEIEVMGWGTRPADVEGFLPPDTRFHQLEGVGHFMHIEQPRMIADMVLDFIGAPATPAVSAGGAT